MHGVETDNVCIDLNWGFDHVLGYWYDIVETKNGEESTIEEWSSTIDGCNGCSRTPLLEFLIKYNLSEEHRSLVALDMPL
jgi:hypothetical protein